MSADLTPREAVEEIRDALNELGTSYRFGEKVAAILSRVAPETPVAPAGKLDEETERAFLRAAESLDEVCGCQTAGREALSLIRRKLEEAIEKAKQTRQHLAGLFELSTGGHLDE